MQNEAFILAMDQGTTSCRAIIFNTAGKKIHTCQEEFTQYFPNEGHVEHDAREIWQKQLRVSQQVLAESSISSSQIRAIGITNQRETTVVWDKRTGEPVHKAIVWQDRRTSTYCDELRRAGYEDIIKSKTGLLLDAYFSATKLKYILDHTPNLRALATEGHIAFGTIDSWLIYNLTGGESHLTDVTNASRTMLFNIHELSWDDELLDLFDIPKEVLPQVVDCDANFGKTNKGLFNERIIITGVAGDQQAALFGQLCLEKGMAKNTYGTGCFLVTNTGNTVVDSNNKLLSTIAWKVRGELSYALEGSVFIGGAVIQWLRDGLQIIDNSSESAKLAASVEDSGGVIFVPALTGLGAPHWNQYARGMIIGINRGTTKAHLTRAAIESIALQVNDLINAMEDDMQDNLVSLRVDGGAASNNFLLQIQSNILQKEVLRPTELETTALGVAYIAGLGAGLYENVQELKEHWQVEHGFNPDKKIEHLNSLKKLWHIAIEKSKNWVNHED